MRELFKGYLPTRDKKSIVAFKNYLSLQAVEDKNEYAGLLAEDIILVDIDDMEQSEIMMDIVEDMQLDCVVRETNKGKHFYFVNEDAEGKPIVDKCATKTKLACGITADIKVGVKQSYAILKYNGNVRPIIWGYEEDADIQPLPKYLLPVKCKTDFSTLRGGDGRNQSLFNYILTLQSEGFSNDEAREAIRLINRYILPEKLDDAELETILRDEAFQKPIFYKKGRFLHDKFATFIRNNNHIVKINGQLHVYRDGVYVSGAGIIERQMIEHLPDLTKARRTEVLSYLNVMITEDTPTADAHLIAFNNGIYNLMTNELENFSPSVVITNKIPWDYNPQAYSEICDRTLNKMSCQDAEIRALLEEAVGYCFYRRNELRKFFILTGDRQNGKSTYLSMVEELLGKRNIVNLDLRELGERFKSAELFGKLANVGDDIEGDFIPSPGVLKKLSSGNSVNVERKGGDPFDFSNYAKLLFSANDIPRIKDKTGAVFSRMIIVPFNATFTKSDPDFDPYIKYKLIQRESMEYLVRVGVEALKRILENKAFTKSAAVDRQLSEYEENNNPILLFFKEDNKIENEPTANVYKKYYEFCLSNSFTPMSNVEFSKQVKRYYGYEIKDKKINGKKYRIFMK